MPFKSKSVDEPGSSFKLPRIAKRPRQVTDNSDEDHAPPTKRRTPSAAGQRRASLRSEPESIENEDVDVDVEGIDPEVSPPRQQLPPVEDEDDGDEADTASSSELSSPGPSPRRQPPPPKADRASKSKSNRIESDEEQQEQDSKQASPTPPAHAHALKPPRPPVRQDSMTTTSATTKALRKPVVAGQKANKEKEKEKEPVPALSAIPAIPRRPKDVVAVKDTQDMDLSNKDVYKQLFQTSAKPAAKNAQSEAKQREINAKRQAAKSALLKARESSFDLQLPTDNVLAFETRLRKLHRWYPPSALGFTYHEELRLRQRQQNQARP